MLVCLKPVGHFLHGLALLFAAIGLQGMIFVSCLIASVFLAITQAAVLNFVYNVEQPIFVTAFVQALILASCTKLFASYSELVVLPHLTRAAQRFPVFVGLAPPLVTFTLNVACVHIIYIQFKDFHRFQDLIVEKLSDLGNEKPVLLQRTLVALSGTGGSSICRFMVAFSYLIFSSTALLSSDLRKQLIVFAHTYPRDQHFPALTQIFFLLSQVGLTVSYAIPLFYASVGINYVTVDKGVMFFNLCVIGTALGFLGSFLESKEPFPQFRAHAPLFAFERNIQAKILLLKYGLLPYVYYAFFETRYVSTPTTRHYSVDPHFHRFAIIFSLIILHSVKLISIFRFVPRIIERRRIRQREERRRRLEEQLEGQHLVEGHGENVNPQAYPDNQIQLVEPDPTFLPIHDIWVATADSTNNNSNQESATELSQVTTSKNTTNDLSLVAASVITTDKKMDCGLTSDTSTSSGNSADAQPLQGPSP